jgi:glycosyltransferase involved in cell wall biosynthesis
MPEEAPRIFPCRLSAGIVSGVRILYFADIRFPIERANGIQTMETCYALGERGHDVRLIVRPDTHNPARDPFAYYGLRQSDRVTIERAAVAGPQLARRVGYLSFAFGRALGRTRADMLMTRDLGTASMLIRLPRSMRAPLIYESHGYAPDVAAALPEMLTTARAASAARLRRLAKREAAAWHGADGYITITSGLRSTLEEKFGARPRTAVIADGVRLQDRPGFNLPSGSVIVGYAGHLYPWKGVDVLIQAVARTSGASAMIVGGHEAEGDRSRLEALAARLGIRRRVSFTRHVEPSQVPGLLRRATILALPNTASAASTHFTSPLKLFEYMAAGRAIVASDLPAIREVLTHEKNALLVPAGDPAALAAAIERLAGDRGLAHRLAEQAFADVPDYTWERRAARIEALLNEVRAGQ